MATKDTIAADDFDRLKPREALTVLLDWGTKSCCDAHAAIWNIWVLQLKERFLLPSSLNQAHFILFAIFRTATTMAPKGSFPVARPDGSFPTIYDAIHFDHFQSKPTKAHHSTHLSLSKSIKMMNSCFKDTGRAVYPMYSSYKSPYSTEDEDNDALPLLQHTERPCEKSLDFIGVATAQW